MRRLWISHGVVLVLAGTWRLVCSYHRKSFCSFLSITSQCRIQSILNSMHLTCALHQDWTFSILKLSFWKFIISGRCGGKPIIWALGRQARKLGVQGQPPPCSKFQASMVYTKFISSSESYPCIIIICCHQNPVQQLYLKPNSQSIANLHS